MDHKNISIIIVTIMISMFVSTSSAGTDLKTINTDELHTLIVDNAYQIEAGRIKHFTIIDARSKGNYEKGHIFSAISVPLKSFDTSLHMLPKDKGAPLVVYCNDAKHETSDAWAARAIAAGYTNLSIYSEGFLNWKKNRMPFVN